MVRTPGCARFLRYSAVSVVSTVTSLTALYIFYRVIKVGNAAASNVLATFVATAPSYYLNRTWAWGKTGRSHLMREVVPFWAIAFISLVLSTAAVALAEHEAKAHFHTTRAVTITVLLANFITYGILWVGKYVVFNVLLFKKDPEPAELALATSADS
jgi:putative flippase GtrA